MNENNILQSNEKDEVEAIKQKIFVIRNQKVMIDTDIAFLYQIETRNLVQAVKRNLDRFPSDFMFQLTEEEYNSLRSQFVTSNKGRGGRRYLPYAFTEYGVVMLSSILNSMRAIQMNIYIVRAFIKMRESLDQYNNLAIKIGEIEVNQINDHKVLEELYFEIKQLTDRPIKTKGKIGFVEKE